MQACMHACYVLACEGPYLSQKLGRINEIKVSMESGGHAGPLWAQNLTQAHNLAFMHAMFLCAWAHISAKLGWIRKMKVSMELGEHTRPI